MFAVGDKVVRIVPVGKPEGCEGINESWTVDSHIGKIHVVTGGVQTELGWSILLDGEQPHTCDCCEGANGWNPNSFRKIQPCEPEFIELLKRIKPKVDA